MLRFLQRILKEIAKKKMEHQKLGLRVICPRETGNQRIRLYIVGFLVQNRCKLIGGILFVLKEGFEYTKGKEKLGAYCPNIYFTRVATRKQQKITLFPERVSNLEKIRNTTEFFNRNVS